MTHTNGASFDEIMGGTQYQTFWNCKVRWDNLEECTKQLCWSERTRDEEKQCLEKGLCNAMDRGRAKILSFAGVIL